jgi:hypothetical protein
MREAMLSKRAANCLCCLCRLTDITLQSMQVAEVDQATASAQLLNFMHDGGRPLEAHAATQFQERLAAQLDKAMSFYHGVFGSLTLVSGSRSAIANQLL